jgi:molecular chaperone GrpE
MTERADTTDGVEHANDTTADQETERTMALEQQLEAQQAKAAEYLENWQRSHADFVNYRRRAESERADLIAFGNATLLGKVLPVLDDFDLALANVPEEARATPWVEGITLIQRKLQRLLESEGVTPIEALGQPFDPKLHEAVVLDEGASEPHTVVEELRKGYRLRDRILRPTLVRVGNQRSDE